jgi:hypothetical protein
MAFLNFIFRHGFLISPLLFVGSAALLSFFILGLVRMGDKSLLASFPLQERQMVQFPEAGPVALDMEGPRLSKRFADLAFDLVASDGSPVAGSTPWLRAKSSGLSVIRMEMLEFSIPGPGRYTLHTRNLGGAQDRDNEHKLVFTKPHLPLTIGYILGIVASAGLLIGSVVLFVLRLLSGGGVS